MIPFAMKIRARKHPRGGIQRSPSVCCNIRSAQRLEIKNVQGFRLTLDCRFLNFGKF
jgi:hypothetical protein